MRLAIVFLILSGCHAVEKTASQHISIHQPGLGLPTVDISFDFEQKWVDKSEAD